MLDINAAKISNVVTFKVDKNSLKEAKDSVESIKKFAEKIQPTLNMSKFRQQMKEIEREMRKAQTFPARPAPPATPKGGGNSSGPGRPTKPGKKTPEERAAELQARRNDLGNLRMENFEKRSMQYTKASIDAQRQAKQIIDASVESYKRGDITLQRMNQTLAHQLDSLRRSHREKTKDIEDEVRGRRRIRRELEAEAKQRQRMRDKELRDIERNHKRELAQERRDKERKYSQMRDGALGLNPRMMVSSMIGAGLFAGGSVVGNTLQTANDRIKFIGRGAENVQANANAIMTMTAWGEQNGVDSANIIKSIDNLKDVRERLGNSMMAAEWDEKKGKWRGGDNGINDIMNMFGWNPSQIKHMQNDPLAFIQATVNEGERRGMNSAQIGRLLENLGDDLMHYQRMFSKNGEGFQETLRMLQRTGAALTNEQMEASKEYTRLTATIGLVGQGMQNYFLEGFMSAIPKDESWLDNVKSLDNFAKNLGVEFANATLNVAKFGTEIIGITEDINKWLVTNLPSVFGPDSDPNKTIPDKLYSATQTGDTNPVADFLYKWTGIDTQDVGRMFRGEETRSHTFGFGNPLENLRESAYTPNVSLGRNQPVVENTIAIPSDLINVTINPSSEFGNMLDARIQNSGNNVFNRLTLATLSGQSGGN